MRANPSTITRAERQERLSEPGHDTVSLVIPACNEQARIGAMLSTLASRLPDANITVVCNGCVDDTADIVRGQSAVNPRIRLLDFPDKLGKGGAIIEGFRAAQGSIIGFVDADESVEPGDVQQMIAALALADGVIASRSLRDSQILVRQPLRRRAASRAFNLIVRLLFGLQHGDTQCGAKVFRREAVKAVLDELTTRGFEFDAELLWRLQKRGYRVVEFPITWRHSEGSTFRLTYAPRMLWGLIKTRLCT